MAQENELLSRTRRIETRVTEIAIALGVGQGAQKPVYVPGTYTTVSKIVIPSPHASIASILECFPTNTAGGDVDVFVGENYLLTLRK